EQDVGLAALDLELVAGDEGDAAPGDERRAEHVDGRRRDAPAGALAAEGGDGERVGEEEGGLLPDLGDQLVEVVGGGGAGAGGDALRGGGGVEEAVVLVVHELRL